MVCVINVFLFHQNSHSIVASCCSALVMEFCKCDFPSCGYVCNNSHSLSIHKIRAHKQKQSHGVAKPTIGMRWRRKEQVPLPRSGRRKVARLAVDRLTHEMCTGATGDDIHEEWRCNDIDATLLDFDHGTDACDESTTPSIILNIVDKVLCLFKNVGERICNALISAICDGGVAGLSFLQRMTCVRAIIEFKDTQMEGRLRREGFKRIEEKDGDVKFEWHWRNPINILQRQIATTPSTGLIITPCSGDIITHPLNSRLGNEAFPCAEAYIKSHSNIDVIWMDSATDNEQSFIAGLQLFSDKSQTSLSSGSVQFYPLHVTLLNFTEEYRRRHIMNGDTIVAYLPVRYDIKNVQDDGEEQRVKENSKVSRLFMLRMLHRCIETALEPLREYALKGIIMKTSDGIHLRSHLLLASYVADGPEAEDLLSVKRGSMTKSPCCRCLIVKDLLSGCVCGDPRTLSSTLSILRRFHAGDDLAAATLSAQSMLPLPPVLSNFPMVGIHPVVDIYRIFRCELLHILSLGASRMLKECTVVMMKDESRKSSAITSSNGAPRTFKSIRRHVLGSANSFLKQVQRGSAGYGLHVDFSKGDHANRLNGFFTETGVVGMIEGKDYDNLDMVFPFVGAIIDRCCGLSDAPLASCFTRYTDMFNLTFRYCRRPGWSNGELHQLSSMLEALKREATSVFSRYQPSEMKTCKWHGLDHLLDDIRDVGNVHCLHGGLFECAHRIFKQEYMRTSRRSKFATTETLNRQNMTSLLDLNRKTVDVYSSNRTRAHAIENDGAFLVKSGDRVTFGQLEDLRHSEEVQAPGSSKKCDPLSLLSATVGNDAICTLVVMLREYLTEVCHFNSADIRHCRLELPASAYVSGYAVPSLENWMSGTSVYLRKSSIRSVQRVVAKVGFFKSEVPRMDSIMVESNEKDNNHPPRTHLPVWFGRALTFVRINDGSDTIPCDKHSRKECTLCQSASTTRELCFLQFYEILSCNALPIDKVDERLGCIRLRWHRTDGIDGVLSASKEYGLVPVDSLRGKVHIVPADCAMESISESDQRKRALKETCSGEPSWSSQVFYLNRFYRDRGDV